MKWLAPYLFLLTSMLSIRGLSQDQQKPDAAQGSREGPVAIGLLLPDHSHADVIQAAEFAIEKANSAGGYKNQEFILVTRTAEGFWGAGSKESVNLVYEDNVCAILGSLDGRNGHLAEQVAAKSHLSYIETFATEPTLSQAFVPWFMRVIPNDNQQAVTIMDHIQKEGGGRIGVLSATDYDSRYALKSLTREVARQTNSSPVVIELDTAGFQQEELIKKLLNKDLDHLVISFDAPFLDTLIPSLREGFPALKIYGNLHFTMGIEKRGSKWKDYEGVFMIRPRFNSEGNPGLIHSRSAYMYDAVFLVIHAVHQVGTDREAITDYISDSEYSKGITGRISFDELGNRQGPASLVRIDNGRPEYIFQP